MQWASKVGKREKKGEDSAWMARSSAPARQNRRASIEVGNHEKHEIHERDNNRTTNGHEWTRISSIHEAVPLILYIFRVFRVFRGLKCFNIISVHSCLFVVQMYYLLVSISVHSWFKCIISVHSCPLVVQMFYYCRAFRGFLYCFLWFLSPVPGCVSFFTGVGRSDGRFRL